MGDGGGGEYRSLLYVLVGVALKRRVDVHVLSCVCLERGHVVLEHAVPTCIDNWKMRGDHHSGFTTSLGSRGLFQSVPFAVNDYAMMLFISPVHQRFPCSWLQLEACRGIEIC